MGASEDNATESMYGPGGQVDKNGIPLSAPLSPYDTKNPDGTIKRFYPKEYYQQPDPNYDPGFFGRLYDGMKNPGDAINSATMGVLRFLNDNPAGKALAPLLEHGAGYSTNGGVHQGMAAPATPAPAPEPKAAGWLDSPRTPASNPSGVPSVEQINQGAADFTKQREPSSFTDYPSFSAPGGAVSLSNPTGTNAANLPTTLTRTNTLPTYALPPGAATGKYGATLSEATARPYGAPPQGMGMPAPGSPGGPAYNPSVATAAPTAAAAAAAAAGAGGGVLDDMLKAAAPIVVPAAGGVGAAFAANAAADEQAKAMRYAAELQKQAADAALKFQQDAFNTQQTNIKPWLESGGRALTALESFDIDNPAFSFSTTGPNADPSYTFRLNEGMKALQNSAAARGGLLSGNAMKGISNYGQESASQEYSNAFNRYQTERTHNLNRLQSLAGVGQSAMGQSNSAAQNFATNAGNATMAGANALAQGSTGAANARASGYMGMTNALNGALASGYNNWQSDKMINALGGY